MNNIQKRTIETRSAVIKFGKLPEACTESVIKAYLGRYGKVAFCSQIRDVHNGAIFRIAISKLIAAEHQIKDLLTKRHYLLGSYIVVDEIKKKHILGSDAPMTNQIVITGLRPDADSLNIISYIRQIGEIQQFVLHRNPGTKKCKGYYAFSFIDENNNDTFLSDRHRNIDGSDTFSALVPNTEEGLSGNKVDEDSDAYHFIGGKLQRYEVQKIKIESEQRNQRVEIAIQNLQKRGYIPFFTCIHFAVEFEINFALSKICHFRTKERYMKNFRLARRIGISKPKIDRSREGAQRLLLNFEMRSEIYMAFHQEIEERRKTILQMQSMIKNYIYIL